MVDDQVDLVTVAKDEKKSLLQKFDIPIEHLSYEYISACTKAKKLEHIVTILRSGEEGHYPDLTRHAEERLSLVKPMSMLLRKTVPVLTRSMLEAKERKELDDDLNDWIRDMKFREKDLEEGKSSLAENPSHLPDVRHVKESIANKKDSNHKRTKSNRIPSCDYSAWDKYDVDTEINRIDLQDEQRQIEAKEQQRKKKQMQSLKENSQEIAFTRASLTGTEIEVIAEQERKKGNEAFRSGDYVEALGFYDSSIAIDSNPLTYNNRAMTYIKLQRYEDAVKDCNVVLSNDRQNVKALLRRASALEQMEKGQDALLDYEAVLKLEPSDKVAIGGVNRLRKSCESRKVRMKIEETCVEGKKESAEENAKTRMSVTNGEPQKIGNKHGSCNEKHRKRICTCEKGPGPSHSSKPLPHFKDDYCIEDKSAEKLGSINEALMNAKLSSQKTIKANETNVMPKQKSIFSYKAAATNSHASRVIIEELTNEACGNNFAVKKEEILSLNKPSSGDRSLDITTKRNTHKSDKRDAKKGESNTKEERQSTRQEGKMRSNIFTSSRSTLTPRKIEVATKYSQPCQTEKNVNKCAKPMIDGVKNPYEFLRAWQSLKNVGDLSQHAQLLRSLASEDLNTGNKLDNHMFSLIIRCLDQHFHTAEDCDLIIHYLKSLSQLSRFSIVRMLMDSNDEKVLQSIFQFLENHKSLEVQTLRDVYI